MPKIPRYLKYIFSLAHRQRRWFWSLAVLLFISVAARLTEPYLYKVIVDTLTQGLVGNGFGPAAVQILLTAIGVWFGLAVVLNITNSQTAYLGWRLGNESSQQVQISGFARLLKLDYAAHTASSASALAKTVDNADQAMWEMTNWWLDRFSSAALGFAGMLVIAFIISPPMTLVTIVVIPVGLWLTLHHMAKYETEQTRVNKLWDAKHDHLADQVNNIITYKLNPRPRWFLDKHEQFARRAQTAQEELNKKWRFVSMLNPDSLARLLVLGAGVWFVTRGTLTLGTLFMFLGLLNEVLTPLHVLNDILPQYTRRAKQIDKFLQLLDQTDTVAIARSGVVPAVVGGAVEFVDVSYRYGASSDAGFALEGVSFVIKPGSVVALVGHSGSGKTTVMKLLSRLMDPTSGRIDIDGLNLKEYDDEALKAQVGAVLQENAMYNETVAQNIMYGNPAVSRAEIIAAARQAQADEFIERLPKGYDTLIGERGLRLSGGEKQRLAIARAILKNPRLVILDEPTSALDSLTEHKVQQGLNALMVGRSTLIIAHRLSTVRHADNIIVIERGRIVCQGSHRALLTTCATYKEMVDLQVGGFLAE